MSATDLKASGLRWRKARRSVSDGACVEVASAAGQVVVRDSKNPGSSWLHYPAQTWREYTAGARADISRSPELQAVGAMLAARRNVEAVGLHFGP
jgi:hypothetical protein